LPENFINRAFSPSASFSGYIFRAAGGFAFSASGGCRFIGRLKRQTVSFGRDTASAEF
jgi:hypothetical protein